MKKSDSCSHCDGRGWQWRSVDCYGYGDGECDHFVHNYPGPSCYWCLGSGRAGTMTRVWRWVCGKVRRYRPAGGF